MRALVVREDGQALVEFALIVPILVLVLFAILEVGQAFNVWLVATNGAREGARLGAVQATQSQIVSRVVTATPTLNPANRTIQVINAQGQPGTSVTVRVQYAYSFVTPLVGNLFPSNPYNLLGEATMRLE